MTKIKLYIFFFINFFIINYVNAKTVINCNIMVSEIIDGDTIKVDDNKNTFKVRLLAINAPKLFTDPSWAYAEESREYLKKLIANKKVCLEINLKEYYDKYHRVLAYVYRESDKLLINNDLVDKGFAYVYIINPSLILPTNIIKLEDNAISNKVNMWSNDLYKPININQVNDNIGKYKIVDGIVSSINETKKSIWIEFLYNNKRVFAIRVPKKKIFLKYNFKTLLHKKIRIRGFVEKINQKFNPFIELVNLSAIEVL